MTISEIQSTYPSAIWFDSAHSGTESGSFSEPYNTLNEAYTNVSDGGVIAVKAGNHGLGTTFPDIDKNITIVGTGSDAILTATSSSTPGWAPSTGVTFKDLAIVEAGSPTAVFKLESGDFLFENCKFSNTNVAMHSVISGQNNGQANLTCDKCTFDIQTTAETSGQQADIGAVLYSYLYGSLGNTTFTHCVFNLKAGTATSFLGQIRYADKTATTKNCIFKGFTGSETLHSTANGTVVDTNNCYSNTGHSGGTNNIFSDPQFVDVATGDFRLRPSSPCIGAGTAS